jgi:DNA-binding transcriptional LysR family regulator
VIARFRTLHPQIALSLSIDNSYGVTEQVLAWQVDIGLVEGDIAALPPELDVEVIASDELVLVVAPTHCWSSLQAIKPEMLGSNELLLREYGSGTREVIERALEQQGVQVSPLLTVPENETIKQLVMYGMGASILPALVVQREVETHDLIRLPITGLDLHREFSLVRRSDKQLSRAAQAFCKLLHQVQLPIK